MERAESVPTAEGVRAPLRFPALLILAAGCSLWGGVAAWMDARVAAAPPAAARPSVVPSMEGSSGAASSPTVPSLGSRPVTQPTPARASLTPTPEVRLGGAEPVGRLPSGVVLSAPGEAADDLAEALFRLMNDARAEASLPLLVRDETLDGVARERAEDLARQNYFGHVGPGGDSAFTELRERGVRYRLAGENLARNTFPREESALVAFEALMASAGHRANILEPSFVRVGVAALRVGETWLYVTVFVDPVVGDGGLEPPTPSL